MFQEKTWKEVTTEVTPGRAPIEGGCDDPNPEWRAKILEHLEDAEKWPNDHFLVFVQCEERGCSHFGAYEMITAGPGYTWTAETIEDMKRDPLFHSFFEHDDSGKCWFMFPKWYLSRENHLKTKEFAACGVSHAAAAAADMLQKEKANAQSHSGD